jgi:alkylation response protein AidB-like acyl-CoA dehydrogenase
MSINVCSLNFVHSLELLGTEDQKRKYIPGVVAGEKIASWMPTAPNAGSHAHAPTTTARPDGKSYILNGAKTFITNGPLADYFIVIARLPGTERAEGGVQLILERGMEGLSVGPPFDKMGMRCSPTSEVFLEEVRVPKQNLLGTEGRGFEDMFRTLAAERSMGASTSIGIMQACLEISSRYVKERRQFGQPIGEFQLVQEMIARMAMNLELARVYCYYTVALAQQGRDITRPAAMVKLFASRAAVQASSDAVQIHGGYGFVKDYHVERYYRDAKLAELGGGTSEIQTRLIARDILKRGI